MNERKFTLFIGDMKKVFFVASRVLAMACSIAKNAMVARFMFGLVLMLTMSRALAFCGFYVAKADTRLYNKASQVIIARDGARTVMSMFNDFQGDIKDFALLIPVPVVLQKDQVHLGESSIFKRIDDFSAPRLVEYFDNPCPAVQHLEKRSIASMTMSAPMKKQRNQEHDVVVEAQFTVGEYDIVILSARESDGLMQWLEQHDYRLPQGANAILHSYIKQGLKFFVAKVNLLEQQKTGYQYLRPLQFAYESKRFMLPIRLGTLNASAPQDLIAYIFTRRGRVEVSNYRTLKIPSDRDIPVVMKSRFGEFYKAMFDEQVKRNNDQAVFTEYFWDIAWCDPCSSAPLRPDELRKAGVFWVDSTGTRLQKKEKTKLTRLHIRYNAKDFPEDLMLFETGDTQNFQARYILHHDYDIEKNPHQCAEDVLKRYYHTLQARREHEAQTTANLTGWDINEIRLQMGKYPSNPFNSKPSEKWWKKIWEKPSS